MEFLNVKYQKEDTCVHTHTHVCVCVCVCVCCRRGIKFKCLEGDSGMPFQGFS